MTEHTQKRATAERVVDRVIAARVASRHKEAVAYDSEKIRTFLMAARKKTTMKLGRLSIVTAMLNYLGGWKVEETKKRVKGLEDGSTLEIYTPEYKTVKSDDPKWEKTRDKTIRELKGNIGKDGVLLKWLKEKISAWKLDTLI